MYWMTAYGTKPQEAAEIHKPIGRDEGDLQRELAIAGYQTHNQSAPVEITELGPSPEQLEAIRMETRIPPVLLNQNQSPIWTLNLAVGLMTMSAQSILMKDRKRANPELPKVLEDSTFTEMTTHFVVTNSGGHGTVMLKASELQNLMDAKSAGRNIFHEKSLGASFDPSRRGGPTTVPMENVPALSQVGIEVLDQVVDWIPMQVG
eukprot:5588060-Amphidinium_carterae.1